MFTNVEQESSSKALCMNPEEYQRKIAEIDKLVTEGKKLHISGSLEEALDKMSIANHIASNYFGTFAYECFLPIFNYGTTLLDAVRCEVKNKPFYPLIDKAIVEDDAKSDSLQKNNHDKKFSENLKNAENETGMEKEQISNSEIFKNCDPVKSHEEKSTRAEDLIKSNGTIVDECSTNETLMEDDDDELVLDEEQTDIELAWNCLEIARKICEKQEESMLWLERKSDVKMALGDCCYVNEKFEDALQEFFDALEIRQKIFSANDRRIAEVYYFIGLTYRNMNEFNKAAEQFKKTKQILLGVVEEKESKFENTTTDQIIIEEVAELKAIIESMEENIQDALESAVIRAKQISERNQKKESEIRSLNTADIEAGVVNDLTCMIKRKPTKRPLGKVDNEQMVDTKVMELRNGNLNCLNDQNKNGKLEDEITGELEPIQKRTKLNVDDSKDMK